MKENKLKKARTQMHLARAKTNQVRRQMQTALARIDEKDREIRRLQNALQLIAHTPNSLMHTVDRHEVIVYLKQNSPATTARKALKGESL